MPNEIDPIVTKLAKISEIMADGYQFLKVRALAEAMAKDAAEGDEAAEQVLVQIERFYNLCVYVESRG